MQYLNVISSLLPEWANTFLSDSKLFSSIVIGVLGTLTTLLRNFTALTENRTLRDHVKQETARLAELVELLGKIPDREQFVDCKKEVQMQLEQSVQKLDALRKEHSLTPDPNSNLTFWQRVFVLFPPVGSRAWAIQALAYIFMLVGPLAIFLWSRFETVPGDRFSDAAIFVVFGGLAFRAWALAERRWAIQPASITTESGPLAVMLVLRQAVKPSMLMAQISMWSCIFCAVESLEDIVLAATKPATAAGSAFLHFGASLLGAVVCRTWAAAEWQYSAVPPAFRFPRVIFPLGKNDATKVWGMATAYVAIVLVPILAFAHWAAVFNKIFYDPIDRIELAFVWLASSIGCNRLLSLHSRIAVNRKEEKPDPWSPSEAPVPIEN